MGGARGQEQELWGSVRPGLTPVLAGGTSLSRPWLPASPKAREEPVGGRLWSRSVSLHGHYHHHPFMTIACEIVVVAAQAGSGGSKHSWSAA